MPGVEPMGLLLAAMLFLLGYVTMQVPRIPSPDAAVSERQAARTVAMPSRASSIVRPAGL